VISSENKNIHPYQSLTPERVLDAVDSAGFRSDGRLLALNSYENRVYQVGIEGGAPLVAKFYRPGRWSDAAVLEEHTFARELVEADVPVVAPLPGADGSTLLRFETFRFALFPRRGGHWPELEDPEVRLRLGRFLGRLHAVGAVHPFEHRPSLDPISFGRDPVAWLLDNGAVPREYEAAYREVTDRLLGLVDETYAGVGEVKRLRLHGDFHPGNILWTDQGAHLVDLDDARTGPAVQDLWMLLSGDRPQMTLQLSDLLEGYEEFNDFDRRELRLIEPLRALRLVHYTAWLAQRWDDPAFPRAFPWFNTPKYWEEHVLTLREQCERLTAPPLGPV
jgi:Ser/Thr protein kinase RdoA (MazF antagonist)